MTQTHIITEKHRTTFEVAGGKPKGSEAWFAYEQGSISQGFGWTEAEARADYMDRTGGAA